MTGESIKKKLLATTLLVGLSGGIWAGAAVAQETDDPVVVQTEDDEDDDEAVQERVIVTGSRLRRNEFTSISPIQTISGEVSRDLGIVDADDVLRQTSVIQGQQTTIGLSTNLATGQAFTTFGSVTPQLRGLSSSVTGRTRNLFLINGRRYGPIGVGGAPANPDVSLIPGTLINNVEILLDGASSVYGSDAIAGAINYELQTDFEGFEVDAFYTTPQIGDGDQFVLSAKFGVTNDNGFIVAAAEYNEQNELTRADRFGRILDPIQTDFGPVICGPEREIDVQTGQIFEGCAGGLLNFGVFGPLGTVIVTPGETNIGVAGFSQLGTAPFDGPDSFPLPFGGVNNPFTRFFPEDQAVPIRPLTERISAYTIGEYRLDAVPLQPTAYFEISYAERDLQTNSINQGVIEVTADTVNNPGIGSQLLVNAVAQDIDQSIDVLRLTGGLKGELEFLEEFGLNNWAFDTYGLFHRSSGTQTTFGDIQTSVLNSILQGTTDPDTGVFSCALDAANTPTRLGDGGGFVNSILTPPCFGVNLFDETFLLTGRFQDQASNDLLLATTIQNTRVEQFTWNGFVTGDLFTLPTHETPIGVVVGAEYRRDSVNTLNSSLQSTPNALATNNADVGSIGARDIVEGFYEISIPLVSNLPFVKDFTVEHTGRFTEDEFAGGEYTWNGKATWRPTDWLQFSGGFGTAFRAPDTGESFGTGIVFAANNRLDPCLPPAAAAEVSNGIVQGQVVDGIVGNVPVQLDGQIPAGVTFFDFTQDTRLPEVIAACEALGVFVPDPLDQDAGNAVGIFGLGTTDAPSFQNFPIQTGNSGNPDVEAETSESFFAKVAFEQPWIDEFDFRFSASYFDTEVDGAIGQLTSATILAACFNLNAQGTFPTVVNGELQGNLCDFTQRGSDGLLTAVNETSFNLGSITSRGIDFNAQFNADLDFLNNLPVFNQLERPLRFSAVYNSTFQLENDEDITGDGVFNENLGSPGFPEYQHNLTTTLSYDRFSFNYRWFFIKDTGDQANFVGATFCSDFLLGQGVSAEEVFGLDADGVSIADNARCQEFIDLPNVTLHDITFAYRADDWAIRAGVRNVADTVVVRDSGIPNDAGTGTPFGLGFDVDGRNFFVNVTKSF